MIKPFIADRKPDGNRSRSWLAAVLGLLLCATLLNYANRFVFTQNALPIQNEFFETNQEEGYGRIAGYFGLGFALGGLVFGVLADRISVRWLYPLVLVVWSAAGFTSGLASSVAALGASRFVLGLFEAGHWPCALRTTQRVFKPGRRTWGNSVLQSGASLGAVGAPLLVLAIFLWNPGAWRWGFYVVGAVGPLWAVLWLSVVSKSDVRRPVIQTDESGTGKERVLEEIPFWRLFVTRRWWLLLGVVICINTLWHYIRVWIPLTLEKDHGYSHDFVQVFTAVYYLSTFFGSLAAGAMSARLASNNAKVHRGRTLTFLTFALLSSLAIPAAFLPRGPVLLGLLLVVAFGSLGLFPIYYSLVQELSAKNQGKVGGTLSFATWGILSLLHPLIGRLVDHNPAIRPYLLAGFALGPLIGCAIIVRFWGTRPKANFDGGLK